MLNAYLSLLFGGLLAWTGIALNWNLPFRNLLLVGMGLLYFYQAYRRVNGED